jgi:hypothetical protein
MKLQKKRLLELATYLETEVKPENFDMKFWYRKTRYSSTNCGTTACAFGHACMIPRFKKLGLRLNSAYSSRFDMSYPSYRGEYRLCAAGKFFGLTKEQASYLFLNDSTIGPRDYANELREFVEWDGTW